MIKLSIEKKPTAPKYNTVSIRLTNEVFKKIKAFVPKDKSISMHQILVSIIETAADEGIKIQLTEPEIHEKKRGAHNDKS